MKERPILFSSAMVCAILDGKKTMTRRVMKPQPRLSPSHYSWREMPDPWHDDAFTGTPAAGLGRKGERQKIWWSEDWVGNPIGEYGPCPYGTVRDLLWVRETWGIASWFEPVGGEVHRFESVRRRATDPDDNVAIWHPSIHMPRWVSRITLEITGIRVERVQDISDADVCAETGAPTKRDGEGPQPYARSLQASFATLWDSINAKRGYGWNVNPFVWCIQFKRIGGGEA